VLEAEITHLTGLVNRLREYESELKKPSAIDQCSRTKLSAVENQRQTYESVRAELENLNRELSTADVKAGDVAAGSRASQIASAKLSRGADVVERHRPSFLRYQHIVGQLDEVRALVRQVASAATRLSELRVARASITSAKENASKELQQLDEASARVTQRRQRLPNTRSSLKPSHSSNRISSATGRVSSALKQPKN